MGKSFDAGKSRPERNGDGKCGQVVVFGVLDNDNDSGASAGLVFFWLLVELIVEEFEVLIADQPGKMCGNAPAQKVRTSRVVE